jgi:hypothetical protein
MEREKECIVAAFGSYGHDRLALSGALTACCVRSTSSTMR